MDRISRIARSRNMAAIKGSNTEPEKIVRKILSSLGYRFRLHKRELPGKPDIFIKSRKAAIFVNGCFWHQHKRCKYATMPKSNKSFWRSKLIGNNERDRRNTIKLHNMGYKVITIWECQTCPRSNLTNIRLSSRLKRLLK